MLHLQKLLILMVRSHGRTTMKSAMEESQVLFHVISGALNLLLTNSYSCDGVVLR